MKIRAGSWHLQVFLQAYVEDRYWLDAGYAPLAERPQFPEFAAFMAFQEEFIRLTPDSRWNMENDTQYQELHTAAIAAENAWREKQEAIYTAEQSAKVKTRLLSAHTSLCPYFWSVVSALVFYYGVVRSTRPLRESLGRASNIIMCGAAATVVTLILGLIGWGIYENWRRIPTPAGIARGITQEYREYQDERRKEAEQRRIWEEDDKQRLLTQQAWEQANPEEVARRRELQARYDEELRLSAKREAAARWERDKRGFKELGLTLGILGGGITVVVGVGIGLSWVVGFLLTYLEKRFGPFRERFSVRSLPETGFIGWVMLQLRRMKSTWAKVRQIGRDTSELIAAFVKAKKERVCPFLTVENGERLEH